ncbi:MAG: hypothetical protein Ct9H90mP16_07560 [Candidatus Poseidoniales archaeon]|nr:MAG: hypothetical protein Ct9H90mP16_07560 [Candidatus Poseidoniales archaeon]
MAMEVVRWGVDTNMFVPLDRDHEDTMLAHEAIRNRMESPMRMPADCQIRKPAAFGRGRLVARKGYRTLLKAMPDVLKSFPRAHLVSWGPGHMKRTLNARETPRSSESVTIEPGLPFDELAQLFRSADLVAYPSYYEGQGLIPLEAMASGTPVGDRDDGPLPEMVTIVWVDCLTLTKGGHWLRRLNPY